MTCPACSRRTLTAIIRDTISPRSSILSPARTYATSNTKRKKTAKPSDDFWIPFEPISNVTPAPQQTGPSVTVPALVPFHASAPQARNTTSEGDLSWVARGSQVRDLAAESEDSMVLSTEVKGLIPDTIQKAVDKDFFFDTSSLRESGKGWNILDSLLPKTAGAIAPAKMRSRSPGDRKSKPRAPLAAIAYHERKAKATAAAEAPHATGSKDRWTTKPGKMLRVDRRRAQFGEPRPESSQSVSTEQQQHAKPSTASTPPPPPRPTSATPTSPIAPPSSKSTQTPPKRLSPDAIDGVRTLSAQYPTHFTPSVLATHFAVPEYTIERILRSKWRPNAEEQEERRERWERRGQKIWESLVEQGVHPPKRWREQGIGGGPRRGPEEKRREWKEKRMEKSGKEEGIESGWATGGATRKERGGMLVKEGIVASRAG